MLKTGGEWSSLSRSILYKYRPRKSDGGSSVALALLEYMQEQGSKSGYLDVRTDLTASFKGKVSIEAGNYAGD